MNEKRDDAVTEVHSVELLRTSQSCIDFGI